MGGRVYIETAALVCICTSGGRGSSDCADLEASMDDSSLGSRSASPWEQMGVLR